MLVGVGDQKALWSPAVLVGGEGEQIGADGRVHGFFGAFAARPLELVVLVDELGPVQELVHLERTVPERHQLRQRLIQAVVGAHILVASIDRQHWPGMARPHATLDVLTARHFVARQAGNVGVGVGDGGARAKHQLPLVVHRRILHQHVRVGVHGLLQIVHVGLATRLAESVRKRCEAGDLARVQILDVEALELVAQNTDTAVFGHEVLLHVGGPGRS